MKRDLPRYVTFKDSRFYFHKKTPKDVRHVLKVDAIWRPLGDSKSEMLARYSDTLREVDSLFDGYREGNTPAHHTPAARRYRPSTPRQAAQAFYAEQLAHDESSRLAGEEAAIASWARPGLTKALARVIAGQAEPGEAEALVGWRVAQDFPDLEPGTPDWTDHARTTAGVWLESLKRMAERDRGDWTGKPILPLLKTPETDGRPDPRFLKAESELDLEAIAELLIAEKQCASGTAHEYRVAARMLNEHLGSKRPVFRITADDMIAFKDALLKTPSNYSKRFPNHTLPQAIAANAKLATPYPVLDITTIADKWLARVSSLLKYAVNNRMIPDHPGASVKVDAAKGRRKKKRTRFTPPDLQAIFASPLLRNDPDYRDEKYWTLLIGLHTGARASEIAQIKLDSIRKEDGVLCFAIEEETKNEGSLRVVPVHDALIKLGLEKRVASLRAAGETHLFPIWYGKGMETKQRARDHGKVEKQPYANFIPRWLNRTLLPSLGIHDPLKVFHSFRHTLKSALENAEVSQDMSDRITGHDESSSSRRYVHYSLQTLRTAINKAKFDGVNF